MRGRIPARIARRHVYLPDLEPLESRQVLSAMLGLTASGQLASFDGARPDLIRSTTTITGLQSGETVLGIDSRPATGQIYGLGSTGRLYTIDPATGSTSLVGSGPIAAALSGSEYDLDFNPVADRLRIVSNTGLNLRVDPNTGEVTVDANLAYASTDAGNGTTSSVVAAAYTSNLAGATNTTFYELDSARNFVVTQGSVGGSPVSPNTGQLSSVSPLGSIVAGAVGMEITADGETFVSQQPAGSSSTLLYRLNLNTGTLTVVGAFADGVTIRDITSAPRVETVYAVTTGNSLISFRSNTPQTLTLNVPILGLAPGESVLSLDFRPATGQLYGFGSSSRIYVIQSSGASAGQATAVSNIPINPAATGSKPSIDFDPSTDRIRLVTDANQDLRIDPFTGAVIAIDPLLAYGASDPAAGTTPSVVAQAFSNNVFGASSTSLYGIDSSRDTLVLQGSVGGLAVTPNSGQLFTVGSLGRNISDNTGLDISSRGLALVAINDAGSGTSTLALVNLQTGALTPIGPIGGGVIVRDLSIAPSGYVQFAAEYFDISQADESATITVTRLAGTSGPLQVAYRTSDGSALAGVNYTAVSGVLTFAEGETVKTFNVPIRNNSFLQGIRTVNLLLSAVSEGTAIGTIGTAVLKISATRPMPGIETATFTGPAKAIASVELTFGTSIDAARAGLISNYQVLGTLTGRRPRLVSLDLSAADYDLRTGHVRLTFRNPFALRNLRAIRIVARGLGANGADSVANYSIQRGTIVRYRDRDGDFVTLGVIGRKARVIVVRRFDNRETYAWVEGRGNVVFGGLVRSRKSDRRTVIDRFVTEGARLRLPASIAVNTIITSG